MNLEDFLKILRKFFGDRIIPDNPLISKRVTNYNILTTILSWFVTDDTIPLEGKSPDFAGKVLRGEERISQKDATTLLGIVDYTYFQDVWDDKELTDTAIDAYIRDFSVYGVNIRKGHECEDTATCLSKIYEEVAYAPKKVPIRNARIINGQVIIGRKVIPLPEALHTPDSVSDEEEPYVNALLRVYAQNEKKPTITLEDLDSLIPFYKAHLKIQRDAFYSAESVRRITRELFSDGIKAFNELKKETYDGIKNLMIIPHKNGLERLIKVISFVSTPGFYTKSFLASSGNGLVSALEKTGLLHILVNEDGVEWVVDYDTDI